MGEDRVHIEPPRIINPALILGDTDNPTTALPAEFCCVVAHIAESLHNDRLVRQPRAQTDPFHVFSPLTRFAQPEIHPASGCLDPALYPPLGDGFSGHTGRGIDLARIKRRIGIKDPGHLPATGAIVGSRDINAGTNEILLDQFGRIAPRDPLYFVRRIAIRIDLDPALCTSERDVNQGAFIRHQCGQRLDLMFAHLRRIPNAALARRFVVAVLHPPAGDHLVAVLRFYGEMYGIHAVTGAYLCEQALRVGQASGRSIETPVHVLKKTECSVCFWHEAPLSHLCVGSLYYIRMRQGFRAPRCHIYSPH